MGWEKKKTKQKKLKIDGQVLPQGVYEV
jgi:hypothetical protein